MRDLESTIRIEIPKTIIYEEIKSNSPNNNALICSYFNKYARAFRKDGCEFIKQTQTKIICECDHLNAFNSYYDLDYIDNKFNFT